MTSAGLTVELTREHRFRQKALAVPGAYWSRARGAYAVDNPDPRTAGAIITLFPEVLIEVPELQDIRDSAFGDARPYDFASEVGLRLGVGRLGSKSLYDWQDVDAGYIRAIMERDGGAHVGWDRGLGKTVVTAGFIQKLGLRRVLIVARNDAKEAVWEAQLRELLPTHNIVVYPDSTRAALQRKMLDRLADGVEHGVPWDFRDPHQERHLVLIVHYQAIRTIAGSSEVQHRDGTVQVTKGGGDGWKRLGKWDLMVYDESHRLASYNPRSNKNTIEGRALSHLRRDHVKLALNLSGTGVMNRPDDLYGQLHFLFPKIYRAKWADWNNRFVDYVEVAHRRRVPIGWRLDKLDELRRELGVFMVYRSKHDVLDLPPLIHQNVELDMLPEQRRVYEQMRDEFWSLLEEGGIKAVNPMDQVSKLRQIATAWEGVPSAKLDFTVNELEESPDEQFVVFTWYKKPGRLLAERLGDQAVVVDGDVSKRDRVANLAAHKAGRARVLIGSIATIGESLNLQYVHEAIRLDRHWNPGVNDQTLDRLYRHGQESRVTFRDLWTKDSVDMLRVKPALASKDSLRKALFGG